VELETLDQLLGGDMPLHVIRRLYPDERAFATSLHALLRNRDVRLFSLDGEEVPQWRWRDLFEAGGVERELRLLTLAVTEQGARRVS
jgi:hypothetical protein